MWIKELKVYTIECDCCWEDLYAANEQYSWIGEVDVLDDEAKTSDWEKIWEQYFCSDCWKWNDNWEVEPIPEFFLKK